MGTEKQTWYKLGANWSLFKVALLTVMNFPCCQVEIEGLAVPKGGKNACPRGSAHD